MTKRVLSFILLGVVGCGRSRDSSKSKPTSTDTSTSVATQTASTDTSTSVSRQTASTGSRYIGLTTPPTPAGVTYGFSSNIDSVDVTLFQVSDVETPEGHLLWLTVPVGPQHRIIDVLQLGALRDGEQVAMFGCHYPTDTLRADIFAIARDTGGAKTLGPARLAWKIDHRARRFVSIEAAGLQCLPDQGME
jgi:hypothetical protein